MEKTRLSCFVVMPFGEREDSRGVTQHLDNVYDKLIAPAVKMVEREGKYEIEVHRADKIPGSGSIHLEMFQRLLSADIVVVDLTIANPNVFYELGIRHALRDRVTVLIREEHTSIPFNVAGQKVIGYRVQFGEPTSVMKAIADDIQAGLNGRDDSPVLKLLGLRAQSKPNRLPPGECHFAEINGRRLEIVTGELASQPRDANVWVNSENVYFSMARPFETSISGTIRWLGEEDHDKDVIFEALEREVLQLNRPANPYDAIITESGGLAKRGVQRICHVAAVWATKGGEFRPVDKVERCVGSSLRKIAQDLGCPKAAVVLMPLFGTGKAGGSLTDLVAPLLAEAKMCLASDWIGKIKRVQFLALTDRDRDACLRAGASLGLNWHHTEHSPAAADLSAASG